MKNWRVIFFILLAGLVILAGALAVYTTAGTPAAPAAAPQVTGEVLTPQPSPTPHAIDFAAKDLAGADVSLAGLRGQVVLVNFWASWCSPCREEMPILEAFYQAHKDEGFVLVAINVSEDAQTASAFIQQNGYTFPVWSDPTGKVLMNMGIRGLPASLFLDRQSYLRQFWSGPLDAETLDELALPLLQP